MKKQLGITLCILSGLVISSESFSQGRGSQEKREILSRGGREYKRAIAFYLAELGIAIPSSKVERGGYEGLSSIDRDAAHVELVHMYGFATAFPSEAFTTNVDVEGRISIYPKEPILFEKMYNAILTSIQAREFGDQEIELRLREPMRKEDRKRIHRELGGLFYVSEDGFQIKGKHIGRAEIDRVYAYLSALDYGGVCEFVYMTRTPRLPTQFVERMKRIRDKDPSIMGSY